MREQDQHLTILQALFEYPLPESVRRWLIKGTPRIAGGLPLLGLPIGADLDNAWGATQYLRVCRPDLAPRFLVIRLLGERALCIDLAAGGEGSPLWVIECNSSLAPKGLNKSFESFLRDAAYDDETAHKIFDRVDAFLQRHGHTYDHVSGGKLPRAHQWRIVRSCVHDRLVGIAALRQDDQADATEIDLFEVADHPLYAPGHGMRSLLALVFADAYKAGSSMRLIFKSVPGIRGAIVPKEIIEFATQGGLHLTGSRDDTISHADGASLFAAAAGLSAKAVSTVLSKGHLALESISYLAATRIWTFEEIEWLLEECPDPEMVLFGLQDAKDWLAYSDALALGRAAALASAFRYALNEEGEEGVDASSAEIVDGHFEFSVARPTVGPWSAVGQLMPGDRVAVLPRPRLPLAFESSLLVADAKKLAHNASGANYRLIVQSAEAGIPDTQYAKPVLDELGVTVVASPYLISDLDNLVEAKFARARRVRR